MLLDKIKSDPGGVVLRLAVVVTDGLSVYPRQGSTGRHIRFGIIAITIAGRAFPAWLTHCSST